MQVPAICDGDTIDRAIDELYRNATPFARVSPGEKAALVRQCGQGLISVSAEWVSDACRAKQIGAEPESEEWLAGLLPTVRMAHVLERNLRIIQKQGRPPLGTGTFAGPGGRLAISLLPASPLDRVLFAGYSGYALMEEGISVADAQNRQAAFYRQHRPDGAVSLILGAGNVSSIAPMDVFSKMFIEGKVCLLKMHPVNAWLGPHLARALAPLIARGYLRLVYGGSDVGARLVCDERISDVHITGSRTTHDSIVWGPPGQDRTRRIRENDPVLKKPITSELGNVGPVAIVPYSYTDVELRRQARNIATMVANNAGFNCNAAHLIITSSRWPQRARFLDLLAQVLERIPPRQPYYPGARERYESLTRGHRRVQYVGHSAEDSLPWAVIRDVDARDASCRLFTTEPFCALISETGLSSSDPVEFLSTVTSFMNDTLWGTLNACIVLPPALERNVGVKDALDRAIVALRYGTIGINTWPAVAYGSATLPWGGHPGGTLQSVQSGSGWVHNTFMLDGVEKSVIRGPLVPRPTPVWFADKPLSASFASRLVRFQSAPGWLKVPGLVLAALKE